MRFLIEITETLQRIVEVEAADETEAERKVRECYRRGEIVLDGDDHVGTDFRVE